MPARFVVSHPLAFIGLSLWVACGPGDNVSTMRGDALPQDSSLDGSVEAGLGEASPDGSADRNAVSFVFSTSPGVVSCREEFELSVTVRNTGSTTWDGEYRMEVMLPEGFEGDRAVAVDVDEVLPSQEHTFVHTLVGPSTPGRRRAELRMSGPRGGRFTVVTQLEFMVVCEPPALDLDEVVWLDEDISDWEQSVDLTEVRFRAAGQEFCFVPLEGMGFRGIAVEGVLVTANTWVFIFEDERWYAATWDWLGVDEACKLSSSLSGDSIRREPFDALSMWSPTPGEVIHLMVSGVVRGTDLRNQEERSNPVRVIWPE